MPNLIKLLRKEMMPNLTKVIRKEMVNFIIPFPSTCCNLAFKLFNLKLAKTRFVSHIHFIGRCLQAKVTPVGFRIHFHPSNFGVASTWLFSEVSSACNSFSRSFMRSNIRAMCSKRDALTRDIYR